MMTFCSPRESSMEGLSLLFFGSVESHTAQWQLNVGTPIEVPDPKFSVVSFFPPSGFRVG